MTVVVVMVDVVFVVVVFVVFLSDEGVSNFVFVTQAFCVVDVVFAEIDLPNN